ncbi:MAG: hypothetical protein ACP5LI_07735 [Hydrogenobaculum sp.]
MTKISELEKEGEIYEIEGIVVDIEEPKEVIIKKSGEKVKVQHIRVADEGTIEPTLTISLWREEAGKYKIGDKIKVKGIFERFRGGYYFSRLVR